jgi:hypothetical protein
VDIKDHIAMQRVVTEYLADFNATSKKPMHLVLFQVSVSWWTVIVRLGTQVCSQSSWLSRSTRSDNIFPSLVQTSLPWSMSAAFAASLLHRAGMRCLWVWVAVVGRA